MTFLHRCVALSGLLLALSLTGCSPKPAAVCSAVNCSGCCDASGTCQPGTEPIACGFGASACFTCQAAQVCTQGICQATQTGGGAGGSGGGTAGGSGGGMAGGAGGGTGGGTAGGTGGGMAGGAGGGSGTCGGTCSGATPVCNTATNTCVACTGNIHCTGATPYCNTTTNTCGRCSPTEGCSGATPVCDGTVPGGQCVQCTASGQCGGATPVCDVGTKTCVRCTTGAGCSAPTPVCDTVVAGGQCVQCTATSHCGTGAPVCNTATRQCVQCTSNTNCGGATPICNTPTSTCVTCTPTAGCGGTTPVCDLGTPGGRCVGCTSNAQCGGATPQCDTGINTCVRCTAAGGCGGSTPVCDTSVSGGQCVQCTASAQCGGSTPVCNTTTRQCVTCTATAGCGGTTPVCNTAVTGGQCVQCTASAQCGGTTPVCNTTTNTCVRCTATAGCSAPNPICDTTVTGGQCVQCTANGNCSGGTPYCQTTLKQCVRCLSNTNCGGGTPVCNTSGGYTCVQCTTNANCANPTPVCGSNTCQSCTATSQCSSGFNCQAGSCLANPESCATAQTLTVVGSSVNFQADTRTALEDENGTCSSSGTGDYELVYRLPLTSPRDVTVTVARAAGQTSGDAVVYLRRAPCATGQETECADANASGAETARAYNASSELFIFVEAFSSSSTGLFDVSVVLSAPTLPPANDSCSAPQQLTFTPSVATASGSLIQASNNNLSGDPSPSCSSLARSTGLDVVYRFSLGAPQDVQVSVQPTGASTFRPVLYLRSLANCANTSLATQLGCAQAASSGLLTERFFNLPAGDYALWVDSTTTTNATFDLTVAQLPPTTPLPNDSCSAPQALTFTAGSATAAGHFVGATNNNASGDPSPNCSSSARSTGRDLVYSFNLGAAQDVTVEVAPTGTVAFTPVYYLRSLTNCASTALSNQVTCVAGAAQGLLSQRHFNLPAGDYALWVDSTTAVDAFFNLTVSQQPPTLPPANDTCVNAQALGFAANAARVTGTTIGAAHDTTALTCTTNSSGSTADVVFSYGLAAASSVAVAVTPDSSASFTPVVYASVACPNGTELACALAETGVTDAPVGVVLLNQPTGTGYVYVDGNGDTGLFRLDARLGAPPNGTCAGAVAVGLTTGTVDNGVVETNALGTNDFTSMCTFTTRWGGRDLVFSFTAPATASYTARVIPDRNLDATLARLEGSCAEASCVSSVDQGFSAGDPESMTFTGTLGTTYWFVVDGYGSGASNTGFFRFEVR